MRLKSTAAVAALIVAAAGLPAAAAGLDDLIAAAKKEGALTTVALPHDWCNYGGVMEGFKAKYPGITINELNPDAGSADEIEAIRPTRATPARRRPTWSISAIPSARGAKPKD